MDCGCFKGVGCLTEVETIEKLLLGLQHFMLIRERKSHRATEVKKCEKLPFLDTCWCFGFHLSGQFIGRAVKNWSTVTNPTI